MDTSFGGGAFPQTVWSSILAEPASPARRERLNRLLSEYWRPVYMVIRCSARKPVEEAKDLAQEFFCFVLDGDLIARYRPEAGRFRHFLKGVLRNFLANEGRDGRAQKRGGGASVVSLDVNELEGSLPADPDAATPDELFDRQWARDVMAASLDELHRRLQAEGKKTYLDVYEAYDLADDARPTYDDLAARHQISVSDVKNYLTHVRDLLQRLILARISTYVTTREESLNELSELFRS